MSKAQEALIEKTKEVASTQYAGTGLKVNIEPDDAKAIAKDIGWALRTEASVAHEPRVYSLESPYSYYGDCFASQAGPAHHGFHAANARMARYAGELLREVESGSAEGRRVERIFREESRSGDPSQVERRTLASVKELRSLNTGGGITASGTNGAVFVSPFFLLSEWVPFRGIERSFADQCHRMPLPPYGMQMYLPYFETTAGGAIQTEGNAVSEATPETNEENAEVKTVASKQVISQQLFERGYTGGGTFDAVLQGQLNEKVEQEVDVYTIDQAITNGANVTGNSSYTSGKLYQDIALGREKLADKAGTRLRPTHFFTTTDIYSYVTRESAETEKRPIVEPRFVPGFPLAQGADDFDAGNAPKWSRFTGTVLPGGVLWFTDDNIPTKGTTTEAQLIVSAPEIAIVLLEGETRFKCWTETLANELKVVCVLDKYVAAVTRHANGTATITGAAYTSTLK